MTAEIAILNRVGVALAADSAVTIGQRADKIWTSADKLFQLSEVDPVGVMVYANAEFVHVPWETIIKCFRSTHGQVSEPTVRDHSDRFLSFLRSNQDLFPEARQDSDVLGLVAGYWTSLRDNLQERLDREADARNGLAEQDVAEISRDEVVVWMKRVRKCAWLKGFDLAARRDARKRYASDLAKLRDDVFGNLPLLAPTKKVLLSTALLMITRHMFGPARSGVVFAGFGAKEVFPSLVGLELDGMAIGRPRYIEGRVVHINHDLNSSVVPFAQQEMVHSFMQGVEPQLFSFMRSSTQKVFSDSFGKLLDLVDILDPGASASVAKLREQVDAVRDSLFSDWEKHKKDYWNPVMTNIATLPKDELAAMAEAFVNLTKFRRRITIERETVGGPIDVAVITKGDGFVWIKRKHYFDARLNPRFMAKLRCQMDTTP